MPELYEVCIGPTDGAWTGKRSTTPIVEPPVSCTLNDCGLSVACSAVMEVKSLRARIRGTPMNITIAGCKDEIRKIFAISNFEKLFKIS